MELQVNGLSEEEVDRPDPSESLEEYLQSLNEEYAETNRVVNPETVNGQPFSPEFNDYTSDQIDQLELTIQPIEEMVVESLVDLADYLDRALNNFPDIMEELREEESPDVSRYKHQLAEAFTVINQILTSIIGIIDIEDRLKPIKQINARTKSLHEQLEEASGESLLSLFEDTQDLFKSLRGEIENIVQVLTQKEQLLWEGTKDIQRILDEWTGEIPSLVEKLQSNPSPDVYGKIDDLVGDIEQTLSYIQNLDEAGKIKLILTPEQQEELRKAHRDLDTGIDELNRAFEEKDVIMICDILEYEVLPYLEDIEGFVSDISQVSGTSDT